MCFLYCTVYTIHRLYSVCCHCWLPHFGYGQQSKGGWVSHWPKNTIHFSVKWKEVDVLGGLWWSLFVFVGGFCAWIRGFSNRDISKSNISTVQWRRLFEFKVMSIVIISAEAEEEPAVTVEVEIWSSETTWQQGGFSFFFSSPLLCPAEHIPFFWLKKSVRVSFQPCDLCLDVHAFPFHLCVKWLFCCYFNTSGHR